MAARQIVQKYVLKEPTTQDNLKLQFEATPLKFSAVVLICSKWEPPPFDLLQSVVALTILRSYETRCEVGYSISFFFTHKPSRLIM